MMSYSAQNFNTVMHAFLSDLTEVFPEDDAIQSSLNTFDDLVNVNYKKPQQMFAETVGKFSKQIIDRDEVVFDHLKFPGVNFKSLWSRDISVGTKHAIWSYLQQLTLLSALSHT